MASSLDQEAPPQQQETDDRPQSGDSPGDVGPLQVGDMVWGKVKSHPWWPGHIFNESFAGASVRKTRFAEGRKPNAMLVAFFGDSSYGWFDPAELVPFSPNFPEMSTQANYRSFVNAVSEAVDEASRRGALAVACKCRDEENFCPTGVDNYVFVDVPGYERGGIYSLGQIKEARGMFEPITAARFVMDLALAPNEAAATYSKGEDVVNFMKMRAMMVGYRRAVFEERDDTYAQAFGVDPAKIDSGAAGSDGKKQERFTQRAVPLSGKLKIAETLSGSNNKKRPASASASSSAAAKIPKSKQKPKPKPLSQIQHQPRFKSTPSKKTAAAAIAAAAAVAAASNDDDNKYLLKRRDDAAAASPLPDLSYPVAAGNGQPDTTSFLVSPSASAQPTAEVAGAEESYVLQRRERKEEGEGEEREKKPVKEKKAVQKRKKLEGQIGAVTAVPGVKSEGEGSVEKKRKKKKKPIDFSSVDLDTTQVVGDLRELALEPLFGKERDAAAPVRSLVLKFRSAIYQKSLDNQAASGKPVVATAEKLKLKKEKKVMSAMAAKQQLVKKQGLKKAEDLGTGTGTSQSVVGRKRGPSDRQEELNVQKKKKIDKIKALASEKKAALASASKVMIQEEKRKEIKVQKPEVPPAPKVPSPTALMMKFPLKSALPTIATLKAKLARFGQIDLSNTRVYWNSHMCKVTFRFKDDAKAALNYVNSNEMFGQSKVQYYIRELDPISSQQTVKSDSRSPVEPVSFRPESRVVQEPIENRPLPSLSSQPTKSILKRPGEDSGASADASNGPRVTFLLDRTNSKSTRFELPPPSVGDVGGGSIANKSSAALPPPPPLLSRAPLAHPTRPPYDMRHIPPPPPLLGARPGSTQWAGDRRPVHEPVVPGPFDPIQPTRNGPFGTFEEKKKEEVDISVQLLGLLKQCSEIVAKVKNSLGYMPYHPL